MTRVLLVGNSRHREFSDAAQWLQQQAGVALQVASSLDDARAACLLAGSEPAVVVACQTRPGEFSQLHIEQLRAAAPLARLVLLFGSWCEGEPRAARRLQGVVRFHWTRWRRALPDAIGIATPPGSIWRLPPTSTEAEQFVNAASAPLVKGRGAVAIWADRYDHFRALADVCAAGGYSGVWLRGVHAMQAASAAIWDGDFGAADQVEALHGLVAATSPQPTVIMAGFPRAEDVQMASQMGATAVVAKPYRVHELLAALDAEFAGVEDEARAA